MSDTAPAGWYPSGAPHEERYWDGTQWTPAVRSTKRNPVGGYWRATGALLHGDVAGAYAGTAGSALKSWVLPLSKTAIVYALLFLGFLGWAFGLPNALIQGYVDTMRSSLPSSGLDMSSMFGLFGGLFDPRAAGWVLAVAFFTGLALIVGYFALRAVGVMLAVRGRGSRIRYADALGVVGTAHLLSPYPLAIGALFCLIPGAYGGGLALVFAGGGLLLALLVAETTIAARIRTEAEPVSKGVISAVVFGGATFLIVAAVGYVVATELTAAGFRAIFDTLARLANGLGGLGGLMG
jgi:hypothetical protein